MKNEHGFIVALISHGKEVNDTPEIFSTGTYVDINDWETLDNTLLSITVTGSARMRILDTTYNEKGLMEARAEYINEPKVSHYNFELDDKYNNLVETLQLLSKHPFVLQKYPEIDYMSPLNVCYKLSELLPISNSTKLELLEITDINLYIEKLGILLESIEGK